MTVFDAPSPQWGGMLGAVIFGTVLGLDPRLAATVRTMADS